MTSPYEPPDAEVTAQVMLTGRDLRFDDEAGSHLDRLLFDRLKDELAQAYDDDTGYGEGDEVVGMIVSDSIKPISAATRSVMARALVAEHALDGWALDEAFEPSADQVNAGVVTALGAVPGPDPRIADRDERLMAEVAAAYSNLYGDGEGEARLTRLLDVAQKGVRAVLASVVARALRAEAALGSAHFRDAYRPGLVEIATVGAELSWAMYADQWFPSRSGRNAAARTALAHAYDNAMTQASGDERSGQGPAQVQDFADSVTVRFRVATEAMIVRFLKARHAQGASIKVPSLDGGDGDVVVAAAMLALVDSGVSMDGLDDDKEAWAGLYDQTFGSGGAALVEQFVLDVAADAVLMLRAATHCALSAEAA